MLAFALVCLPSFGAATATAGVISSSGGVPFVENTGQWTDDAVRFSAHAFPALVQVKVDGSIYYVLPVKSGQKENAASLADETARFPRVICERLRNARNPVMRPEKRAVAQASYFLGDDQKRWRSHLPAWNALNMGEVYDGISLSLQISAGKVEKIFNVAPGADPAQIRLAVDGAGELSVDASGDLLVAADSGSVRFSAPKSWQEQNGRRKEIAVRYKLDARGYGFELGAYDRALPLVIDPALVATYLGGSGSETAYGVAVDAQSNVYVVGQTTSPNFPTSSSAYDRVTNGWADVFVSVFSPDLKTLTASTLLGGSLNEFGFGIVLAPNGNVYITGYTVSTNFPTISGAWDQTFNGVADAFVACLNPILHYLLYSTYFGGSNYDEGRTIVIDEYRTNIFIAGTTLSTNLPTSSDVYSNRLSGAGDGFIAKFLSTLGGSANSTYLGGGGSDSIRDMAISQYSLYPLLFVTGTTDSTNFPSKASGGDPSIYRGYNDAFVSCLGSITNLVFSRYIGGTSDDEGHAVVARSDGGVASCYISGLTHSTNSYMHTPTASQGEGDVFIASATYSSQGILTRVGGTNYDDVGDMQLVISGSEYIYYLAGRTDSANFPATASAYETNYHGDSDAFVARYIQYGFTSQLDAVTFLGGSANDSALGLALDPATNVVIVGTTSSDDFPASADAYNPAYNGSYDAFIAWLRPALTITPDAPNGLAVSDGASADNVQLSWNTAVGAEEYEVWRRSSNSWLISKLANTTATNMIDAGAGPGLLYEYMVYAQTRSNRSDSYAADTGWRATAAPAGFSAGDGVSFDAINLSWSAVTGADYYTIYRTAYGALLFLPIASTTGVSYNDSSAYRAVIYSYYVKGYGEAGGGFGSDVDSGWRSAYAARAAEDYDGDRLADPVIYEEATGTWRAWLSTSGYTQLVLNELLGTTGWVPASADYDGDGLSDVAVYSSATGDWCVLLSSSAYFRLTLPGLLGGPGWSPAPADFDGDRLADPAVYGERSGEWQAMLSVNNYAAITVSNLVGGFGWSPAPADYDGDGKADPCAYEESTGNWNVLLSSGGYAALALTGFLGGADWRPAPADFDGDGRADPAVFNQATGEWRALLSSANYALVTAVLD